MDEELRRLLEAVQAKLAQDASKSATVREIWEQYAESPEATALRSWNTERGRGVHLVRLLGTGGAQQLTLVHVDDYRKQRATEPGRRKETLTTPASRNREVVRLVRVLNWAVERKLLDTNPLDGAPLEPEENTRRTSIEAPDLDRLQPACLDHRPDRRIGLTLWAMVATKFDSGLRRSELCRLRRVQLRAKDGTIELHQRDTKARKGRVTILSSRAAEAIRSMPRDVRFAESPFVFLTTRGKPYHPRTFLRMFQEAAAAAGLEAAEGERIWAHDLRAGFAGQCLDAAIPERDIMDMGGWSTREVFDRYHRRRGAVAVARARARLEEARKGPKSATDVNAQMPEHRTKTT